MLPHTKRQVLYVLQQKLSIDYVCNRRLLSFSFKTKMAEEQKYLSVSLRLKTKPRVKHLTLG